MFTAQNTISVSELRKNTLEVFERIDQIEEPITIFSHSKPVGVFMSMKIYKHMKDQSSSEVDKARAAKAWDFFINPPEDMLIKDKNFDPVKAIRELRD